MSIYTNSPVGAGDCQNVIPEFGRTKDVERIFGLRRGSLYNLLKKRKVKSVLWRIEGSTSGVRLWYLPGIRESLLALMNEQEQDGQLETHE